MNITEEARVQCPYCGEAITVVVDRTAGEAPYVEDCEVCCRPIEFRLQVDGDGDMRLETAREDD